jgi:hypothetical protein
MNGFSLSPHTLQGCLMRLQRFEHLPEVIQDQQPRHGCQRRLNPEESGAPPGMQVRVELALAQVE